MVAANGFMIVFRFFHIFAGAFWFGSAALFSVFLGPAAAEVGPSSGPLFANLVNKRKLTKVITASGGITVLAGLIIYWHDWHLYGSFSTWIGTPFGKVLTVGAIAAIIAMVEGAVKVGRNVERLVHVGGEIAAVEGPPPPELLGRMQALQQEIKTASIIDLVLLVIAITAMSTARFW